MLGQNGLRGDIIRTIIYGAGITSMAAMVYHAGPYIEIGGWRLL